MSHECAGHERRIAEHTRRIDRWRELMPGDARDGESDLSDAAVEALLDELDARSWRFATS